MQFLNFGILKTRSGACTRCPSNVVRPMNLLPRSGSVRLSVSLSVCPFALSFLPRSLLTKHPVEPSQSPSCTLGIDWWPSCEPQRAILGASFGLVYSRHEHITDASRKQLAPKHHCFPLSGHILEIYPDACGLAPNLSRYRHSITHVHLAAR